MALESKAQVIEMAKDLGVNVKGLEWMPEFGLCPTRVQISPGVYQDVPGRFYTMSTLDGGKTWTAVKEVSEKYKLVQHWEALGAMLEGVEKHMGRMGIPEVNLQFGGVAGSRMFNDIRWKNAPIIVNSDKIVPIFRNENSVDLSRRFLAAFRAERLICSNGLTVPDSRFPNQESVRKLHKQGTLCLESTVSVAIENMKSFFDTIKEWDGWTKNKVSRLEYDAAVESIGFSEKQVESIRKQKLRGFSTNVEVELKQKKSVDLWTAYNSVTQYITDNTKNLSTEADRSRKAADAFEKLAS